MTNKTKQAKVVTPEEAKNIRYPLPASMKRAAGLLRHRRKDLERHLKKTRQEWDRPHA